MVRAELRVCLSLFLIVSPAQLGHWCEKFSDLFHLCIEQQKWNPPFFCASTLVFHMSCHGFQSLNATLIYLFHINAGLCLFLIVSQAQLGHWCEKFSDLFHLCIEQQKWNPPFFCASTLVFHMSCHGFQSLHATLIYFVLENPAFTHKQNR